MKYQFECLYCGHKAELKRQTLAKGICSICKETQLIKVTKITAKTGDWFGYRFDPQPETEVSVVEPSKIIEESDTEKSIAIVDDFDHNELLDLFGGDWMD